MYPSRGNNSYGQQQQQQPYPGQSAYGQNSGPDGGASQLAISSRHAAMLSGHPSSGSHYGGQYTPVYGSMAHGNSLQDPGASTKGSGPYGLEGRSGYGPSMQESPKYVVSGDYPMTTQNYAHKGEHSDYPPVDRDRDRHHYVEQRPNVYNVRDSQNEPTPRFADSVAYGHHQHQADIYDRLDATSALRKELLQAHTLQSASIEGSSRQGDYLAVRHAGQELLPYNGRTDPDPNTLSILHRPQHAQSILGAVPRRDVDDLVYANPGYGVSLPPGRNYGSGKGLRTTPHEPDYTSARTGYARVDDRKERDEERERRREKERERERERRREKERERERRDKERERETKRVVEIRRERTPPLPRVSRDRGGSSRVEASNRRRSPVKEKRRDYVCKVYSSSLVDVERDYLSIDKRYPRLFTSPECSKVIVNWSRDNLKIPLNVPVSFEHDFVQDDAETQHKEASTVTMVDDPVKSEHGSIRWNAKVMLMSGLSHNALEELSSERDYEDRIPHFCNMLRFACLKKGNSLIAIGGSWETCDGNDPSVDKSTLIKTALRHAKDLTGLDLNNCQHWNPFLEIHYDRLGKNGCFSHKEVTVLYIPDLSECLPSVDAWRDQWLAHKKTIAERERLHALKKQISREKKEGLKDKEPTTPKNLKKDVKPLKKKAPGSSGSATKVNEKSKAKVTESGKEGVQSSTVTETKNEGNNSEKKTGNGKKKIIRKIVKKKVVVEKDKPENAAEKTPITAAKDSAGQNEKSTGTPSTGKTVTKKKIIIKVPVKKIVKKEDEGTQSDVAPVIEQENLENKPKSASGKTTVKKKIIKKVMKRKVVAKKSAALVDQESQVKLEVIEPVSKSKAPDVVPEHDENKKKKLKDGEKSKGKDVKDTKIEEEIPRHPGLFLQTKESKDSKLRSLSLSLDSLLGYDDNDTEESTFELSLFAETFNEMLQYQMGSRILTFLQKLRIKFLAKRNEKKRQLEEASEKKEAKTPSKRVKTDNSKVESKSVKTETLVESQPEDEKIITENVENTTLEGDEDVDEDSEEDPDEDEDMTDASPEDDSANEEKAGVDKVDMNIKSKNVEKEVKNEEEKANVENKKKENFDKELLQAFRFFDRNRVGHIRVEDMRLIIHNLGNFLSHRIVKDLVQSALLESNTGRDDRILYNRLVRMDV